MVCDCFFTHVRRLEEKKRPRKQGSKQGGELARSLLRSNFVTVACLVQLTLCNSFPSWLCLYRRWGWWRWLVLLACFVFDKKHRSSSVWFLFPAYCLACNMWWSSSMHCAGGDEEVCVQHYLLMLASWLGLGSFSEQQSPHGWIMVTEKKNKKSRITRRRCRIESILSRLPPSLATRSTRCSRWHLLISSSRRRCLCSIITLLRCCPTEDICFLSRLLNWLDLVIPGSNNNPPADLKLSVVVVSRRRCIR